MRLSSVSTSSPPPGKPQVGLSSGSSHLSRSSGLGTGWLPSSAAAVACGYRRRRTLTGSGVVLGMAGALLGLNCRKYWLDRSCSTHTPREHAAHRHAVNPERPQRVDRHDDLRRLGRKGPVPVGPRGWSSCPRCPTWRCSGSQRCSGRTSSATRSHDGRCEELLLRLTLCLESRPSHGLRRVPPHLRLVVAAGGPDGRPGRYGRAAADVAVLAAGLRCGCQGVNVRWW